MPEILNCKEFVNADNIAAGISPFNPSGVAFDAGRIMLNRIHELMKEGANFALETTLATRSYVSLVKKAQSMGYKVSLLYFWLVHLKLQQKELLYVLARGHMRYR